MAVADWRWWDRSVGRRSFLQQAGMGLGGLALTWLERDRLLRAEDSSGAASGPAGPWRGVVRPLHTPARAKRVIHLYMAGGPSHLETLDPKPKLAEMHGEPMPASMTAGQQIAQLQGQELRCFAPQFSFKRFGQSGQQICELFPHLGREADSLCIVRSMHTDQINHDTAHLVMNTGTAIAGRPSMGAWTLYGLGSESEELPGFVVLTSVGKGGQAQPIAARQWHSGFLPGRFQGVQFQAAGDPVMYLGNPPGVSRSAQRQVIERAGQLNSLLASRVSDPEIQTRIEQYELAFRMQASVPDLMDLSGESPDTLAMYGTEGGDGTFASNCLLARRLSERGVRFVQVYHRGWDHHGSIKSSMEITAREVDQASAALLRDLRQRGLLDETLVIWGGEFGRTPMAQGSGRDHHIQGFSIWMAGGGVQGGVAYGQTDELGYKAIEQPVHVNDFHATLMHLLGIDHRRLTYRYQGRDFRLTDVGGRVIAGIL